MTNVTNAGTRKPVPDASEIPEPAYTHRIPALDGVRGFAVLWVICHNVGFNGVGEPGTFSLKLMSLGLDLGWMGVQIFFVLSGFLITGILLEGKGTAGHYRNFVVRRALRIFPIYYVFLFVMLVILPATMTTVPPRVSGAVEHQIWYWLYAINWCPPFFHDQSSLSHLWSLAIEEQFYLIWPAIILACRRRTAIAICLLMIVSAPIVRLFLVSIDPMLGGRDAAYAFTVARWDALAAGALLAFAMRDARLRPTILKRIEPLLGATMLMFIADLLWLGQFSPTRPPLGFINQSFAIVFSLFIVSSCLPDSSSRTARTARTALDVAPLRYLGKYSYAMYLLHFPIRDLYLHLIGNRTPTDGALQAAFVVADCAVVLALTTAVALLTWRYIERPFLDLKSRFPMPKERAVASQTSR